MSDKPRLKFRDGDYRQRLETWCRELGIPGVAAGKKIDRGARACLKRCALPGDAVLEPAFLRFVAVILPNASYRATVLQDNRAIVGGLTRVAVLTAHVRKVDAARPLASQLAEAVMPLRLQGLLRQDDPDLAVQGWRRLLPLLSSGVHVFDLADLILNWREQDRQILAFDYFTAKSLAESP